MIYPNRNVSQWGGENVFTYLIGNYSRTTMNNLETTIGVNLLEVLSVEPNLLPEGRNVEEFVDDIVEKYYDELEANARAGVGYFESLEYSRDLIFQHLKGQEVE